MSEEAGEFAWAVPQRPHQRVRQQSSPWILADLKTAQNLLSDKPLLYSVACACRYLALSPSDCSPTPVLLTLWLHFTAADARV